VARRSSAKHRASTTPSAPTPTVGPDDEYQSRLDDELDDLD
jgi:hypothetical protein